MTELDRFESDCLKAGVTPTEAVRAGGLAPSTWFRWRNLSTSPTLRSLAAARRGLECLVDQHHRAPPSLEKVKLPESDLVGAENLERNVSRTDEPGSSASAAALAHTTAAHQVAKADAVEGAARDDAVIGSATRHAGHAPPHGDIDERLPGGAAAGGVKFGRVEVSQANLDPTCPALSAQGLDAEAVAVADIDDRAGEGAADAQLGRHGAAIRDSRAGIGGGRSGEREEEGGQGGKAKHGAILEGEGYRRVSA